MIKLDEQEMDEAIDRAIEKFWEDYVQLYDVPLYGRNNTNMPNYGYVVPSYYAKPTLRKLCIRLIVELCEAESEKADIPICKELKENGVTSGQIRAFWDAVKKGHDEEDK